MKLKEQYKKFLDKIEYMLSRALDTEETNDVESIDLLYDILELIEEEQRKFENE